MQAHMSGYLIDLFFSFKGRISRREWLAATAALAVIALGGIALFNDSFDESLNAIRHTPTMAAFLWALVCLFAFTALCAKRLRDCDRPAWLTDTISIAGALAIVGWGLGLFLAPLTVTGETLALWALIALTVPAIIACAGFPTEEGD
jgi:uncharacterized membrane protein YhaH (DUF805 family)